MVIFRRWKVSLPLLLLAAGATTLVAFTVKPDYTMTSYIQFIPAKVAVTDNVINAAARNPWNQLGLDTLGQASIYTTQTQDFLDSLKAGNHTDNFTLTITYPNPIVTVEVVGKTPEDASETTGLIVSRLRASAQSLQEQSGVQPRDLIPTQRLDQGKNIVASGGKVKRALAAVAAAGLLLTAGGTVGFDALVRRRNRKREALAAAQEHDEAAAEEEAPVVPAANGRAVAAVNGAVPMTVIPAPRQELTAGSAAGSDRTAIVIKRTAKVVKPAATYRSVNAQPEESAAEPAAEEPVAADRPETDGDAEVSPSDVRVVLEPERVGGENGGK